MKTTRRDDRLGATRLFRALRLVAVTTLSALPVSAQQDLDQVHYRWRNDDGTEVTASFAAGEDAKLNLPKSALRRLRFEVANQGTAGSGPVNFELQFAEANVCSSGAPSPGAKTLAAGYLHTCVRLSTGAIDCWGDNSQGQLGDGNSPNDSLTAVPVVGISNAEQVTAGELHTCASFGDGTVECWGGNAKGELGDGTLAPHDTPAPVSGINDASQVMAGSFDTCTRLASGAMQCTGYNGYGELGDNSTADKSLPVPVSGMADAIQSTAGHYHTCALRQTGAVECWGLNQFGQLGDGNAPNNSLIPTPVSGLVGAVEVSAGGYHTCSRSASGNVSCWGRNTDGQLGDGNAPNDSDTPVAVAGLNGVVQLASGGYHTCALVASGSVYCWGNGTNGQLGQGLFSSSPTPVMVSGINDAVEIAAGHYHTCAVLAAGDIACWGANFSGQLGDGTINDSNVPVTWTPAAPPTLAPSYVTVPTGTGSDWQIVDSTYFADGDPTSDIAPGLTNEATNFVSGELKDAGNTTGSLTLAADTFTEIEFALRATANATDGANYCFRLYDATNARTLDFYTAYAEASVASAGTTNYRSIGTAADYNAGTVDATNGAVTIFGSGTAWVTANRGTGDRIWINGTDYTVLSVDSETELTLTAPFIGATGSGKNYTISRQYSTIQQWEDCISFGGACSYFPVASADLVADGRSEVGVLYKDSVFALPTDVEIDGSVTDPAHTITLTAAPRNRHHGVAGAGVVIDGQNTPTGIKVLDDYVTLDWLEYVGVGGGVAPQAAIKVVGTGGPTGIVIQNVLIHDFYEPASIQSIAGIRLSGAPPKSVTIRNCMIWDGDEYGIEGDDAGDLVTIENCSIDDIHDVGASGIDVKSSTFVVRNTIVTGSASTDFEGPFDPLSSNNVSSDASAPGPGSQFLVSSSDVFVNPGADLHLRPMLNPAVDAGIDLSASFTRDIDDTLRTTPWDVGADDVGPVPSQINYRSIGTAPDYTTGTVSVINGTTAVYGNGTSFRSANRGRGDRIQIDGLDYLVLDVVSETELTLAMPFTGASGAGKPYVISRQFVTLFDWENCVRGGFCSFFPVSSPNLVTDDRKEIGIVYDDGSVYDALVIDGATTDATHDIVLTVDPSNRHNGVAGTGVVVDPGGLSGPAILVQDDHVTIEWLEIRNSSDNGILVSGLGLANHVVLRNNIVHDLPASGIRVNDPVANVDIYNNVVYGMNRGVFFDQPPARADVANNTVFNCGVTGYAGAGGPFGTVELRNNIGHTVSVDFSFPGGVDALSDYNLSGDGSAPGINSLTGVGLPALNFVSTTPGTEDLHIQSPSAAENVGTVLGEFTNDIDDATRSAPWDIGADEAGWPPPFRIHYRSIGTDPGILASSGTASAAAGTTTITFTASLPWNVGVGDELVLDPGGINEVVYLLSRDSSTQVTVQTPLVNNHSSVSYALRRAFTTLQDWENAREGDLVVENRREIGVAYNDGVFTTGVSISGSKTDAVRYMELTVARSQRHFGIPGMGARVDGLGTSAGEILIEDDHTRVEWLEVFGAQGSGTGGIKVRASSVRLGELLVHDNANGVRISGSGGHSYTIRNSIVYGNTGDGIKGDETTDSVVVDNCTVFGNADEGLNEATGTPFTVTNTLSMNNGVRDFGISSGIQSYTISSDGTGVLSGRIATTLINPGPGDWVVFTDLGTNDFHLRASPENDAVDAGSDLSAEFTDDIDSQPRPSGLAWDIGADELGGLVGSPSISSFVNQTFVVGSVSASAATFTISEDGVTPSITASNEIRIRIPAGFNMKWDPLATALFFSGSASTKVGSTVKAFEDFGQTVVLDVLTDFGPNDDLVVNGLGFWSFTAPSPAANLELEVGNDGVVSALDDKTITVTADVNPNLSSDDDQRFTVLQPPVAASPMTITEGTTPVINSTNDIRIRIPVGFNMTWDPGVTTIGVSGPGTSHVDTTVSYEDSDQTLVIPVLSPFGSGEHIVLTGLRFLGFTGPSPFDRLVLDVGVTDFDDKTVTIEGAADVPFLTATATDSQVTLEWLSPSAGMCDSIVVRGRSDGIFPMNETDGYSVAVISPCTLDTRYSATDPMAPLSNGNLYAYAAFVEYGGMYTTGEFVKARPMDTALTPVRWAYSTGATSMAPPGLRIWSGESYVYTVANDAILHAMNGGSALTSGNWPANWRPFAFGAPAQARPIPFPYPVGAAANGAVFVGSQDGSVYAIDADKGTEEWSRAIASMVQASPAGHFKAFDVTALDVVVVGTRNSTAANTLEALNKDTGTPVWSFDNSPGQLGDGTEIGIISGAASMDYLGKRIYFASRQETGGSGSTDTLWCLDISSGSPELAWAKPLGNIDGSPILYQGVVYVGTNAGVVYAADAASGNVNWSLSLGDGPTKAFLFPQFGSSNVFVATTNNIWSIADNGFSASINWQVTSADVPAPSTPIFVPGTTKLLVGSGDGHLYQIDVFTPLPVSKVMLGDGTAAVGAPTMDILKSMIYVGTEEGVVYGVAFPIP